MSKRTKVLSVVAVLVVAGAAAVFALQAGDSLQGKFQKFSSKDHVQKHDISAEKAPSTLKKPLNSLVKPARQPFIVVTSNPEGSPVLYSLDTELDAEVGDKIMFTREIYPGAAEYFSWVWNYDTDKLECYFYPTLGSSDFQCTVLEAGSTEVNATLSLDMKDGSTKTLESNSVFLK